MLRKFGILFCVVAFNANASHVHTTEPESVSISLGMPSRKGNQDAEGYDAISFSNRHAIYTLREDLVNLMAQECRSGSVNLKDANGRSYSIVAKSPSTNPHVTLALFQTSHPKKQIEPIHVGCLKRPVTDAINAFNPEALTMDHTRLMMLVSFQDGMSKHYDQGNLDGLFSEQMPIKTAHYVLVFQDPKYEKPIKIFRDLILANIWKDHCNAFFIRKNMIGSFSTSRYFP